MGKAQEAILKAQRIAAALDQQQVDTVHLLKGMLETDEDLVTFLLQKANVNIVALREALEAGVAPPVKLERANSCYEGFLLLSC